MVQLIPGLSMYCILYIVINNNYIVLCVLQYMYCDSPSFSLNFGMFVDFLRLLIFLLILL